MSRPSFFIRIAFGTAGLLLTAPSSFAQATCNHDGSVCDGDKTYAFYGRKLHSGVIALRGEKYTFIDEAGQPHEVHHDEVASTHAGECTGGSYCIGAATARTAGTPATGKIVAVFRDGFAVVDEGGTVSSVQPDQLILVSGGPSPAPAPDDRLALTEALAKMDESCGRLRSGMGDVDACFKPQENPHHEGTFSNTILNHTQNAGMVADLGAACANFLTGVYQGGGTLASISVIKAAKPINSIHFPSTLHGDAFYHYTKSPEILNLLHPDLSDRAKAQELAVKNHEYDKIFEFYKDRAPAPGGRGFWDRVHYMAEDPVTSQYAGNYRVDAVISPQARTVVWNDSVWTAALAELGKRYPGFNQACGDSLNLAHADTYGTVRYNNVLFMIAEDSGIDLVDYNSDRWFMMINPKAITQTRLEYCRTNEVPRGYQPERNPTQFIPSCVPYVAH